MLGFLRRKPKLAVDRRPALEAGERILAWADVPDDQVLVVTNLGLWLPGRDRLGWHRINKAAWSGRELRITAAAPADERDGYTVVVDEPVQTYLLLEPGDVPEQVRARVTKSVAYTSHHPLPGGGVRVAARRVPRVDGLWWTVRYDPGTPPSPEAVAALVADARAAITGGRTVAPPG